MLPNITRDQYITFPAHNKLKRMTVSELEVLGKYTYLKAFGSLVSGCKIFCIFKGAFTS